MKIYSVSSKRKMENKNNLYIITYKGEKIEMPEELEYFYTKSGLEWLRKNMIECENLHYGRTIGPTGFCDTEWYSNMIKNWRERRENEAKY